MDTPSVSPTAPAPSYFSSDQPTLEPTQSESPKPTVASLPPTSSSIPSAEPSATSTFPSDAGTWWELGDPGFGMVDRMPSSATNGTTSVVSGHVGTNDKSGVEFWTTWASDDGLTWHEGDLKQTSGGVRYTGIGVVPFGAGFMAYANYNDPVQNTPAGTRFFSSADGINWRLVSDQGDDLSVTGMTTIRDLIVVTSVDGNGYGETDVSPDGVTWRSAPIPASDPLATGSLALTNQDDRAINIVSQPKGIEVWSSADGYHWGREETLPGSPTAARLLAWFASGSAGSVILAFAPDSAESSAWYAWHSSDGSSWQSEDPPRDIRALTATPNGFVAAGRVVTGTCCAYSAFDIKAVSWASGDGVAWTRVPISGSEAREIDQLISRDGHVIGLGIAWSKPDEVPSGDLWVANPKLLAE